jgi:4'-phosphopantetheinyl transferase
MSSICCTFLEKPHWDSVSLEYLLLDSQIRIHRFYLPNHKAYLDSCYQLLDVAEKNRASKYHQIKDSERFILARGLLKILSGKYLGIPAIDVKVLIGENKKPFLSQVLPISIEYNISHSGNWILIAFHRGPIGIDVEQIQSSFNFESILHACFNLKEQEIINNNSNSRFFFYMHWTRKEAFVKATSKGLDENLPNIPCLEGVWQLQQNLGLGKQWDVISFQLDEDHVASISFISGKKNILFIE